MVATFKCRVFLSVKNKLKEAFGAELYTGTGRPVTIKFFENLVWWWKMASGRPTAFLTLRGQVPKGI